MAIEHLDQSCKVRQIARQPVNLVDHNNVDLAIFDICHQPFQAGAVDVATRKTAIVVTIGQGNPALVTLAGNVGQSCIALRLQAVVFHVQAFIGGLAGVDRAAPLGRDRWHLRIRIGGRLSHADILIEDNAQRQLEFGDDNRAHWRDIRPPMAMDVVIYPASGVIDVLAPGGSKTQKTLLEHLGKHVFKAVLQPRDVEKPTFLLNRLRDGFELFDSSECDLAAHRVEHIRLSQAKVRAIHPPICDYLIKPPGEKDAPDVLACLTAQQISPILMGQGFNIIDAVVSLYFEPVQPGKASRVLHVDLKQSGISNLRDMEEADARLVESLLRALGVMQSPVAAKAVEEHLGGMHE